MNILRVIAIILISINIGIDILDSKKVSKWELIAWRGIAILNLAMDMIKG